MKKYTSPSVGFCPMQSTEIIAASYVTTSPQNIQSTIKSGTGTEIQLSREKTGIGVETDMLDL